MVTRNEEEVARATLQERFWYLVSSQRILSVAFGLMGAGLYFLALTHFQPPTYTLYRADYEKAVDLLDTTRGSLATLSAAQGTDAATAEEIRKNIERLKAVEQTLHDSIVKRARAGGDEVMNYGLVNTANADEPGKPLEILNADTRRLMAFYIIGIISALLILCLVMFFVSKDARKIKFADDMMRSIFGFFVGVFTGLLGLPPG